MTISTDTRPAARSETLGVRAKKSTPARALRRFAGDANSVLERQLCTAGVYLASHLMLFAPNVRVQHTGEIVTGAVLVALATVVAFLLSSTHTPSRAAIVIPLIDIIAVGLLRSGTGGAGSVLTILMVLPVLSLGVEPGRLPLLLGGPTTIVAMLLPLLNNPNALSNGEWSRVIFVPLILGLTCLSANELTRRLRSRVRAVQRLRREQEKLLADAQEDAVILAATSALEKESTQQLSRMIDAVTEQAIIATDSTGLIEIFNAGAEKMLQVAAHDVIGRPITAFYSPTELDALSPDGAPFACLVAEVVAGRPQVSDWTYITRDQAEVRVQVAATARRDAAAEIDGFLFVATDVTDDRKQAQMKDEFVSLISHELRTPLSSILGYLELIGDDEENPLSAEQQQFLTIVERNANRLLRLVSDLLFTAQVESGRFRLQEQNVDLHAIVAGSLETAAPVAASRDVGLRLSATDEPVAVWGDPVRLSQAVDNLISNAIKFTPAGGRVAVTLGTDDEPSPTALISVSDTGIGIPAEEVDRLFSRFFRASTATQNAIPGVGLGLTITKAIADSHHGGIRVASTVGQGTTFTLRLPSLVSEEVFQ